MASMRIVASVVCIISVWPYATAFGATFTVDRTDDVPMETDCNPLTALDCSLRGAIIASNLTPGKDTVVVPAGTYVLTNLQLQILDDVDILGSGGASSILQQTSSDRVLEIRANEVMLFGLTIMGGELPNTDDGAGIWHIQGSLKIEECLITGNLSDDGGSGAGIYSAGASSSLEIVDSEISENVLTIGGDGAGLKTSVPTTLLRTTVTGNRGGSTPGISAQGSQLTIRHSEISGHEGGFAGLKVFNETLTIDNSQFLANDSVGNGGAILLRGTSSATITDSFFWRNTADQNGGAIYVEDGASATIGESLFELNEATQEGGAITSEIDTQVTVGNTTFSSNTAGTFGGGMTAAGTVTIESSTFSGNSAGVQGAAIFYTVGTTNVKNNLISGSCSAILGTVNSLGGNVESPGDSCFFVQASDTTSVTDMNLALGPLQDNGGPTDTHALMAGSTAIDAGVGGCPLWDQRVYLRIDGACDSGAFEEGALAGGIFVDGFESGDTTAWSSTQ